MKPINREELDDFQRKYEEERQKLIYEKEEKRLMKQEEIENNNENMPKQNSMAYYKMLEERKKQKEQKDKEKLDKIYNQMKIKQFSEVVHNTLLPKVDEKKKKELENRISELVDPKAKKPRKKSKKNKNRILLKKRDPSKPNKYKWELKLNNSVESIKSAKYHDNVLNVSRGRSQTPERLLTMSKEALRIKAKMMSKSRSKSAEKIKPMLKPPDYLKQMRAQKLQEEKLKSNTVIDKNGKI